MIGDIKIEGFFIYNVWIINFIKFILWNNGNYFKLIELLLLLKVNFSIFWLLRIYWWVIIIFFGFFVDLEVYCKNVKFLGVIVGFC